MDLRSRKKSNIYNWFPIWIPAPVYERYVCVHMCICIKHYMNVHMDIFLKSSKSLICIDRFGKKHHPEETTAKLFTSATTTWVVPDFIRLRQEELKSRSARAIWRKFVLKMEIKISCHKISINNVENYSYDKRKYSNHISHKELDCRIFNKSLQLNNKKKVSQLHVYKINTHINFSRKFTNIHYCQKIATPYSSFG